jgi:hypothetical protein
MAATTKGAFTMRLTGHPAANRDATVKLVNTATGQTIERKPFLDGTLTVRDLDPGAWEIEVRHPHVLTPLFQEKVRVLPQLRPFFVPIPIRPDDFRDSPIRDVPDADLAPVQQTAAAARDQLGPITGKAAGEVIRADDWNQLVAAVADLAGAVLELTHLVSPHGHDHPEIAEKIDEVQGNVRRFTTAFGRSLLELRRDIENENLRRATTNMLDVAGVVGEDRGRILARVDDLELSLHATPVEFTSKLAATGTVLAAEVNRLAQAQGADADAFLARNEVKQVMVLAQEFAVSGGRLGAEEELDTYRRTGVVIGGSKLRR